jgi:hypothetical protein
VTILQFWDRYNVSGSWKWSIFLFPCIVRPLACHSSLAQIIVSFRLAWLRWNGPKLTVLLRGLNFHRMIQKRRCSPTYAKVSATKKLVEEAFLIFRVVLASGGALWWETCEQHHHESDDSGSLCLVSTPSDSGIKNDWAEWPDTHPVDGECEFWPSDGRKSTED